MSAEDGGRFEIAPVTARRRIGPFSVVVVALAVIGAAMWKPWAASDAPRVAVGPASSPMVLESITPSFGQSSPNGRPPGTDAPAAADRRASFGLDLASIGGRVERASWGVAAAYVPVAEIIRAEAIGRPWVTPVVNWQSLAPDNYVRGPTLDRDETATVALAVTWPAESGPRSIELEYIGPAARGVARATSDLPRMVPLSASLPRLMSTVPSEWLAIEGPGPLVWERQSGTLFLPSEETASTPADWLTGGWPPGEYAFRLELDDGSLARLPFVLGG
jgi:hypothetical protein